MPDDLEIEKGTGAIQDEIDNRDLAFSSVAPFDWELGFDIELVLGYRQSVTYDQFWGTRGRSGWGVLRYAEIVKECREKNIKPFLIPVKDQGGSSSCTGQALATYLSVLNMIETGQWVEISPRDIYAYISLGKDKGARLRDALKLATKRGVATRELVPCYINNEPMTEEQYLEKPEETEAIKAVRIALQSKSYTVINGTPAERMEAMAWATLLNFGCYFGVSGESNGTWRKEWPQPPIKRGWGHAIFCGKAGTYAGKKAIELLNSWGDKTGSRGWQKLGENYFNAVLTDGADAVFNPWTLADKPNAPVTNEPMDNEFVKIIKDKNSSAVGFWIPCTSPDALKTLALGFGKVIATKDDGQVDFEKTIEGTLELK